MDALTIMFYGNKTLMDALNAVDTVDWDRPNVCGVWSVKDIVSHLAASRITDLGHLRPFHRRSGKTDVRPDGGGIRNLERHGG